MGKKDTIIKQWLSDKNRFADLFNAFLFQGAPVIAPSDLTDAGSEYHFSSRDKNGKNRTLWRTRDLCMYCAKGRKLLILACENQQNTDYAMPARIMLYDALEYNRQLEDLRQSRRLEGNFENTPEFLSGCKKEDKLSPVLSLVFYFGEERWEGPADLYHMLDFPEGAAELYRPYINNYKLNLIDVNALGMAELKNFHSDLRYTLGLLSYKEHKELLAEYIEKHAYFRQIDYDSYEAARILLGSETLLMKYEPAEGGIDMCKALEDLYADGQEAGILKGMSRGMVQGRENTVLELWKNGLITDRTAARKLDLSLEEFRKKAH